MLSGQTIMAEIVAQTDQSNAASLGSVAESRRM